MSKKNSMNMFLITGSKTEDDGRKRFFRKTRYAQNRDLALIQAKAKGFKKLTAKKLK